LNIQKYQVGFECANLFNCFPTVPGLSKNSVLFVPSQQLSYSPASKRFIINY